MSSIVVPVGASFERPTGVRYMSGTQVMHVTYSLGKSCKLASKETINLLPIYFPALFLQQYMCSLRNFKVRSPIRPRGKNVPLPLTYRKCNTSSEANTCAQEVPKANLKAHVLSLQSPLYARRAPEYNQRVRRSPPNDNHSLTGQDGNILHKTSEIQNQVSVRQ